MKIHLSNTDLLSLVNGKSVTIERVEIVGGGTEESRIEGGQKGLRGNSRTGGARPVALTGHFFMRAKWDGVCYDDACDKALRAGAWMVRDADRRKNYCTGHGVERFPDLKQAPEYQEALKV